ncbi:MAG: lipopolysaccharide kinase InaA family protein [Planctomycetota bacterium]
MQLAQGSKILSPDFRGDPERPAAWIESRGEILRELPGRRVFRARAGGVPVIVKESLPVRLKHRFRDYARTEAERALAAAARGVPVVRPLAWARLADGRQLLLLRDEQGARTLQEVVLEGALRGRARHALARRTGELFAALQNAGIRHRDPHAGNVLVLADGALLFSDAKDMRPGHYPRPEGRAADLARFALFFLTHASRVDMLLFWGAYGRAAGLAPDDLEILRGTVLERVPRAFRRLSVSRAKRALRRGQPVRIGPFGGVVTGDLTLKELERIVAMASGLEPGPHVLKQSPTGWTFGVGDSIVAKVFLPKYRSRPWRDLLRGTRAERALFAEHALRHRRFETPEVLAVLRDGPPPRRSILVMRRETEALPLEEVCRLLPPARSHRAAVRLGRTLRRMHDWGLRHRDLKKDNLLLTRDGMRVRFLDLDGVRQCLLRPVDWQRRARDLANLDGSLFDRSLVPTGLRLRFLDGYLGGETPPGFAPGEFPRSVARQGAEIRERRASRRP